ncbi:cyclic nucleotide-binding domain-containing protein [Streptomyces sp. NPDC057428]|uniref:cyclic nucleotide-binding domain-containing protein n=1 Tax=Streptomyces sp. NPDC057428 TaxID=3346129 RepID=UPI0036777410
MSLAQEVNFTEGTRLFEEGGAADQFWIVRSGTVTLDMRVPGRGSTVIERLGPGELVGWSWLLPPYEWCNGAEAVTPLRTHQFDAMSVRMAMDADPAFGLAVGNWVIRVLAYRLQNTRARVLDQYAIHGSAETV